MKDARQEELRRTLDFRTKLRQIFLKEHIRRIANNEASAAPVIVELDPTSYCNLNCPECISSPLLNRGSFSLDELSRLTDDLIGMGVVGVILVGGGEPLTHVGAPAAIRVLAAGGLVVGLTTNGTLIDRHLDVIARHVAWTRVSIDAATPETYWRFRPSSSGKNAFHQVIANVAALAKAKASDAGSVSNTKVRKLGYSFLLMSRRGADGRVIELNFGEVEHAAKLARDLGCDYFEVKPEYDMEHRVAVQDPALIFALRQQLDRIAELEEEDFAILRSENLSAMMNGDRAFQPKDYDACPVAELRTLITSTGAYVCPYHRGNPRARYGDVRKTLFSTLWRSSNRAELMQRIQPDRDCRFHCIRHSANVDLLQIRSHGLPPDFNNQTDFDPFL